MITKEGILLKFECVLTSPFHSTLREFKSMLQCTPFISGSTFRGAVLDYLIRSQYESKEIEKLAELRNGEEIKQFHLDSQRDYPTKYFFHDVPKIIFSFGNFIEPTYAITSKISVDRTKRIPAEGLLVNLENITSNNKFNFEITLIEGAKEIKPAIIDAVKNAGLYGGIGRFKSTGFGRFEIVNVTETSIQSVLEKTMWPSFENGEITLRLCNPLILGSFDDRVINLENEYLRNAFTEMLYTRAVEFAPEESKGEIEKAKINSVRSKVKPEFTGRFSLESDQKENKLSAWIDSTFYLDVENITENLKLQLTVGSHFGIGEWRDFGFGRFKII